MKRSESVGWVTSTAQWYSTTAITHLITGPPVYVTDTHQQLFMSLGEVFSDSGGGMTGYHFPFLCSSAAVRMASYSLSFDLLF